MIFICKHRQCRSDEAFCHNGKTSQSNVKQDPDDQTVFSAVMGRNWLQTIREHIYVIRISSSYWWQCLDSVLSRCSSGFWDLLWLLCFRLPGLNEMGITLLWATSKNKWIALLVDSLELLLSDQWFPVSTCWFVTRRSNPELTPRASLFSNSNQIKTHI